MSEGPGIRLRDAVIILVSAAVLLFSACGPLPIFFPHPIDGPDASQVLLGIPAAIGVVVGTSLVMVKHPALAKRAGGMPLPLAVVLVVVAVGIAWLAWSVVAGGSIDARGSRAGVAVVIGLGTVVFWAAVGTCVATGVLLFKSGGSGEPEGPS